MLRLLLAAIIALAPLSTAPSYHYRASHHPYKAGDACYNACR